jgi:hypothetical protein
MTPERANLITEEIFTRLPVPFCRVAGAKAAQRPGGAEDFAVFQFFSGCAGLFRKWHGRC